MEFKYGYSDSASHYYHSPVDQWGNFEYTLTITNGEGVVRNNQTNIVVWKGKPTNVFGIYTIFECVCGAWLDENDPEWGHRNEAGGICCPHKGDTCGYHGNYTMIYEKEKK